MILHDEAIAKLVEDLRKRSIPIKIMGAGNQPFLGREGLIKSLRVQFHCYYVKSVLLRGRAGSGKTTLAHELAKHSRSKDNLIFIEANVPSLLAGCEFRGAFEKRIGELFSSLEIYENVVLFLDEAHTLANTSHREGLGMMDMIKPLLLGSNIRLLLATTDDEFGALEHDPAFLRRFAVHDVPELSSGERLAVLRKYSSFFQKHQCIYYNISDDFLAKINSELPLYAGIDKLDQEIARIRLDRIVE